MTMHIPTPVRAPMALPRFPEIPSEALARIIAETAAAYGTTSEAIKGPSRAQPEASARQAVFLRLRGDLGWSWPRIGRAMDRDPTTARYGANVAATRRGQQ